MQSDWPPKTGSLPRTPAFDPVPPDMREDAWATLRILEGDPNRLGQGDVAMLRNALQQARNFSFLIAVNSKEQ